MEAPRAGLSWREIATDLAHAVEMLRDADWSQGEVDLSRAKWAASAAFVQFNDKIDEDYGRR